jgi:hypothetical protein
MKMPSLKQIVCETVKENEPAWARFLSEEIQNVIGAQYFDHDVYIHTNSNLLVYIKHSDILLVALEPTTTPSTDKRNLTGLRYYMTLSDKGYNDVARFKNISLDDVKKRIRFYLK